MFCLLTEKNREKINVLDTSKWLFYVMSTEALTAAFGDQKTVTLSRIAAQVTPVEFDRLKAAVGAALDN